ncbi:AI-2E family transporter [Gleimia hominis]|uniref:AI-2E family transporter n=1 Tax=Gleimia hominis TaxID=595468 RepID=UPI0025431533|nr:AI-2E family transporter [Gleimia hominis]WIK63725.1 AI-2E family transporter [Gleimia hominis]
MQEPQSKPTLAEFLQPFKKKYADLRERRQEPRVVQRVVYEGELAEPEETVPRSLRMSAEWAWRFLVVIAAVAVGGYLLSYLTQIVIPVLLALLFAVLLDPVNRFLQHYLHFPRTLSAAVSLLLGIGFVGGLISVASTQIILQVGTLAQRAQQGVREILDWLAQSNLGLNADIIHSYVAQATDEITQWVQANTSQLASGALSVTASIGTVLSGLLIALFCLFFFLKEGRRIWLWFVRILPEGARVPVHESAIRGWITLGSYARTQILVAAIDAVGIGLGAYFLNVPLVIPLAVLVFVGAFIPIVGAISTGAIAVMVALVDQGLQTAVIMFVVILLVQQIEGNFLHPLLMSNAVSLHPIAVLLAVAAGGFMFGIPGALFAVPILAFVNTSVLYLHGYDKFPEVATQEDRPGGKPGELDDLVRGTYDPKMMKVDPETEEADAKPVNPQAYEEATKEE